MAVADGLGGVEKGLPFQEFFQPENRPILSFLPPLPFRIHMDEGNIPPQNPIDPAWIVTLVKNILSLPVGERFAVGEQTLPVAAHFRFNILEVAHNLFVDPPWVTGHEGNQASL